MKNPWDKEKTVAFIPDVRKISAFVDKGMDKCPNLDCLGKIHEGMEIYPHREMGLFWFEPDVEGWA